jgi:hypothetical protein
MKEFGKIYSFESGCYGSIEIRDDFVCVNINTVVDRINTIEKLKSFREELIELAYGPLDRKIEDMEYQANQKAKIEAESSKTEPENYKQPSVDDVPF